jgi:hypothetical protein
MATEETLRAEVKDLRLAITGLANLLDEKVQAKVETEVAAQTVPREELQQRLRASGRRVAVAIVLLVVLLGGGIVLNRVTLNAARRDLSEQVGTCFLRPGSSTPAQTQACARRFGADYVSLQQRSRAAGADFASLRTWAKERGWKAPSERQP